MSKLEFSIVSPFNGELITIQIECDVEHQEQIKKLFEKEKQNIEYKKHKEKCAIEHQERLTKKVKRWECNFCGKTGGLKSTYADYGRECDFFCKHCQTYIWLDVEEDGK